MKNRLRKISIFFGLIIFIQAFNQLAAQVGTGYNYMPSYVTVTGGGAMPDIANGYTCNCDGTGATDATSCLQAAMDSAASQHKPLLIPYTAGYYKINRILKVKCSVIGIGGMPTIKQTADSVVLSLRNNMTGWIHNMHCIGTYGVPDQPTEHAHIIDIGGVNGVTISNNYLENAMGDIISDNAQGGGADTARNVLITNNTLKNCMRTVLSIYWISDRWAIMNNLFYYSTGWANVIEIEPLQANCYVTNIEVGYNNIQSPGAKSNYYSYIMDVTNYNDKTPGGGVVGHHNWGKWGVPFGSSSGYSPATVFSSNGTPPPPLPAVPTGFKATSDDAQVLLLWTTSSGATSYNVYRGTSAGGESATAIATGITDTTYLNTGLTNGISYFYKVAAANANGTSPLSLEVNSIPVIPGIPAVPIGLSAKGEYAQVALSWAAVAGAASYTIYRGTTAGNESGTAIASGVTDTTYTNTGLTNETTYFYKLAAVNSHGISLLSDEASATPAISTGPPAAPTCLAAQGGKNQVALSWTSVAGATSYNVYCGSKPAQESATAIGTNITTTTYTNTGLTNGKLYYYKVAAVNENGTSILSLEAGATSNNISSMAPINVITIPGNNRITITWTAPAGAASYLIYSSLVPNAERDPAVVKGLSSATTSYTIDGLVNGITYYFMVVSYNSNGVRMGVSNEASTAPQAVTLFVPLVPMGLTAKAGNQQIVLTWRASQYATGYNVYRGTTADGESATAIANNIPATSFTNTALTNDIQYFYKVAAVNYIDTSALSAEVSATAINVSVHSLNSNILDIYPNPAISYLTISNVLTDANITVFTMDSKIKTEVKSANQSTLNIDVSNWHKGIYLIKVQTENGIIIKKVVVE